MNSPPIPVTLLSGFLGAGKTTLLKRILEESRDLKVAVVVNDVAALNVDANLVRSARTVGAEDKLVELQNGCVCCTLRADLIKALAELAAERRFDAIVVESSGVAEPQQVAEMFQVELGAEGMEGAPPGVDQMAVAGVLKALNGAACLEEVAALDSLVTVVDCSAFDGDLTITADLLEQFGKNQEGDEGVEDEMAELSVAQLLIEQIEFANIIVLNKCDLVSPEAAASVEAAVRALNAKAEVIRTTRAQVPVELVLRTGKFNMNDTSDAAGWLVKMRGNTLTETKQYGIASFVYQERTPFHPVRLHKFLEENFMCDFSEGDDGDGETEGAGAEEER